MQCTLEPTKGAVRHETGASATNQLKSLKSLLPYYSPYRLSLTSGVVFVVIGGALSSVNPWLVRSAVDDIQGGAGVRVVARIAVAMLLISLMSGVCRYGMRELLNGLSRRIETDLRNDLYAHLLSLDATYYGRTRTGELMARLTNDLSAVRMAAGPAIMYLINTLAGGLLPSALCCESTRA